MEKHQIKINGCLSGFIVFFYFSGAVNCRVGKINKVGRCYALARFETSPMAGSLSKCLVVR